MIYSFIENFIKTYGKDTFIKKLNNLQAFLKDIRKSVIKSLLLNLLLLIISVAYMFYNVLEVEKSIKNINLLDTVMFLNIILIGYALIATLLNIKKILKIKIANELVEELKQDLDKTDNEEEAIILASKWLRKMSIELSVSRIVLSRIVTKSKLSNYAELKQVIL